ncbi:hypothetical protein [Sphingobacterium spiritivorum]|uniref:hypothetical protein n=1 Tax=Sphingobacterium spiritivorum TaxID=258 RepID=UPI001919DF96|nr:hypothetical protein [Sphingobacterium spiritivorum]QQT26892.1 hypothetical protein I6J02_03220 [Sphingobacterium spiritivorum]
MNLSNLHLEKIKIPKDVKSKIQDDIWECSDYQPFEINISIVLRKGEEVLNYSLEFSPSETVFENINKNLQQLKYIADGYGWQDFTLKKLITDKVQFTGETGSDSDSETCVLFSNNEDDFRLLLKHFSTYIRELSVSSGIKEDVERTISVKRFWSHTDENDGIDKPEIMFKRPRVDYRISEYVWEFIETNILAPKKLLQKNSLNITLFPGPIKKSHKFFYGSVYDTESIKFRPSLRGSKLKEISISCSYNGFTETMSPMEYASIVYDMYCSFIVDNFKKITKEECDELKIRMNPELINSFEFPASFENQKYSGDGGGYGGRSVNFVPDPNAKPYNYKEAYLEHYKH